MKRKRLLSLATAIIMAGSMWAQDVYIETDLTSQFSSLTNWKNWTGATGYTATDFCPKVTTNAGQEVQVCEKYEGTCETTGDIFHQTVTGLAAGTYKIELYGGAAFTFGRRFGSAAFTGDFSVDTNNDYAAGDHIDTGTGVYLYATTENDYQLEIPIYYATNFPDGAATVVLNNVVVGNSGQVTIGLKKTSQSTNWHVIQLKGVTATVNATALLNNLKTEANSLIQERGDVTGTVLDDLQTAIDAEPSAQTGEAYSEVIENLKTAIAAFKAAFPSFDKLASAKNDAAAYTREAWPYASDAKWNALSDAVNATANSAEDAEAKAAAIVTAYRQFVESNGKAEGVADAVDFTSSLSSSDANVNDWSGIGKNQGQGYTDGEGIVAPKYFDGGWNANQGVNINLTQKVTLPAGRYLLQITARASAGLNQYTLSVGEVSVDLPKEGADQSIGTFGGGWSDKWLEFESDGSESTITLTAKSTASQQWISFNRLRLVQLEEIVVPMADENDYAALATAITDAEANTLGFDEGEYAPYNNVAALQALADAKAIDPNNADGNTKEVVQNVTSALTSATWTPNASEVNAIFDGSFEADYSGQTGNINPIGWQRVKGAAADGYNVRLMNGTNAGLAATTSGKAIFTKQSAYYGYVDGYTMPLNADTWYKVTFIYGGWGDCKKDGYVSMAGPDGAAVELTITDLPVDATNADSDPNAWKSYTALFKTGDAGNYVLGLRKKKNDTSGQSQYVYGDLSLVKATTIDEGVKLAAGKYATRIYPFAPQPIDGITFYSCAEAEGNALTLVSVETPEACVPYILGNDAEGATEAISIEQAGVDIHVNDTYTAGYLTGVFAPKTLVASTEVSNYVLQTQKDKNGNDKQSFYIVSESNITVPAYRAYLTVPTDVAGNVKAFNLAVDDATAINALDALTSGAYEGIYTVDGMKLNRIEKGVNILKMADGTTRKVVVK